ncbi:hypothetical protein [Herbaspirillum frisingense]|uniref:PD-(D/E)XK nuclease family protein n=1 Tax=Herbaspirillum frisingense TaxID=92645 RepID=A0ABU1PIB6_9BURK|nr:hypothetical protein [Herbaspirillum frisingense]MDR6585654.1 hypothetical protein [Herbaspirillum frisingense]
MKKTDKKLFDDEAEMQEWLKGILQDDNQAFEALVSNSAYLNNFSPSGYAEEKFLESYKLAWGALTYVEILTSDANISLTKTEVLRPDFILYDQEKESIVIVELKNRAQATREAGTEIGAYAAAIRKYMPLLADSDIVNVIVSSAWPPLLRHFIFNEIVWLGRSVICVEPMIENGEKHLRIKDIRSFTNNERAAKIPLDALGGHIIGLECSGTHGESLSRYVPRMRLAGMAMARKGTALRSHGFAFLWRTNNEHARYCFTLVNAAPLLDLGHLAEQDPPFSPINSFAQRLHRLVRAYGPGGHTRSLSLIDKHAKVFMNRWCKPVSEAYFDWEFLKQDIFDNKVKMLGFYPWGVFAEAFHRKLAQRISKGKDTTHDHCETGWDVICELVASC